MPVICLSAIISGNLTLVLPEQPLSKVIEIANALIVAHAGDISYIHEGQVVSILAKAHPAGIIALFESCKNELISISSDCAKFWLISNLDLKEIRVYKFSCSVDCVCISQAKNLIYVGSESKVIGYLLPDFVEVFNIKLSEEVTKISLVAGEKFIAVCRGNLVIRIANPAGGDFNISSSYIDAEKIIKP